MLSGRCSRTTLNGRPMPDRTTRAKGIRSSSKLQGLFPAAWGCMGSPRGCEGDMTVKRDFKRRVRQRQARTGESYVTARRHMVASRPEDPAAGHGADDGNDEAHTGAAGATDTAAPPPAIDEGRPGDGAAGDGSAGDRSGSRSSGGGVVHVAGDAGRAGRGCRVAM